MLETVDKERMNYICNKIIDNEKIIENNAKFWTLYLDNQLREFVILYNFNFFEVASRFHGFISIDNRYEFNENEIRRHWSFLHSMRYLNKTVDNDYYTQLKKKFMIEEEIKEKKIIDEENRIREEDRDRKKREEEEENKRNMESIQKVKYERFNLITIDTNIDKDEDKVKENNVPLEKKNVFTNLEENKDKTDKEWEDCNIIENTHKDIYTSNYNQENKTSDHNKINDKNLNDHSDDFFESDEFINDIFINQKKLKHTTLDNEKGYYNNNSEPLESYEANLFPISTLSNQITNNIQSQHDHNNTDYCNHINKEEGIEKHLENTTSFDDIIKNDSKLNKQYENLNTYYNFAVKSLNYFIPKLGKGLNEEDAADVVEPNKIEENKFEDDVVKKTSYKINQLLMDSVR